MSRLTAKIFIFIFLIFMAGRPVLAIDPYATGSAVVSATVISTSFDPPVLLTPNDNAATNNPREQLVWRRPDTLPATPLHHYDVYLDGVVFAASVSDGISSQNYYFYSVSRTDSTFYLNFNTDLAQGYHTWRVVAYDDYGTASGSATRTFYLDSSIPILTLQKVDRQTFDPNQRIVSITNADPLLSGTVEAYVNMQFYLICPQNIPTDSAGRPSCIDQFYSGNNPESTWQHRFYNLEPGLIYTVSIAATDAGGNSVILPEFYLQYVTTPTATSTPTTSEPSPSSEIIIPPIPFHPLPPPAPPVPRSFSEVGTASPIASTNSLPIFFALLVFGLPSHLVMTGYGTKTRLANLARFLYTLFFPFLGRKKFRTLPFATLEVFQPDQINATHQTAISDINGEFSLKEPLPENLFVKIICTGRVWKNIIISKSQFLGTCLFPKPESPQTPPNRLRRLFMTYRGVPLGLACLTSGVALVIFPSFYFLIYLYLSFHLVFTEYLYPRLQK